MMRIIQETVPGRQITLAHIIAKPREIVFRKLGLNPNVDYNNAAIGVLTMSPGEMAIIASDIATKSSNIDLGFVDRFSGTLIITGSISNVETTLKAILDYSQRTLDFTICKITRT
ncbi:MAG: BMC domain-containing protein [Syntrophomonadaceae bacterium]|nr:BMC domain-containing protein [Syntrophomonadaceae bacterium]